MPGPSAFLSGRLEAAVLAGRRPVGTLAGMGRSRGFLDVDEELLLDVRPHWSFLSGPLFVLCLALVGTIAALIEVPQAPSAAVLALAAAVGLATLWVAARGVRWLGTRIVLTDRRLVLRRGMLGRSAAQLRLARVVEIHCRQTLGGRLVRSGTLVVDVQGGDLGVTVSHVRDPWAVQGLLARQLDRYEAANAARGGESWPAGGAAPVPGADLATWHGDRTPPRGVPVPPPSGAFPQSSIPEQLVQLDGLRRRGIITDGEFEAKKAQLLSRL